MFLKTGCFKGCEATKSLMFPPRFPPRPTCWKAPREASGILTVHMSGVPGQGTVFSQGTGFGVWGLGGKDSQEKFVRLRHRIRQL